MTHSGENNKENETMRIHDDEEDEDEDEDDNEDEEDRNNEDDGPWMDEPILFLDQFQLPQELLGSGSPTKYQPDPKYKVPEVEKIMNVIEMEKKTMIINTFLTKFLTSLVK